MHALYSVLLISSHGHAFIHMASPSFTSHVNAFIHMASPSFTAIAAFLVTLAILLFRRNSSASKAKQQRRRLPPGPPGWPVVGNLFQVARYGKPFIHYVRDMRPLYGPIFTLRMASRTLIVVTSPDLAHEALIQKGHIFATRPSEMPTRSIFSADKFTVNSSVHGPVWLSLRRNLVSNMLTYSRIRGFRSVRHSAMDRFIQHLRADAQSSSSVHVLKTARFAVFCILLSMCFGVDMDEETVANVDRVLKKVLIAISPRIDDYLPLLSPLFGKQRKEALEVREEEIRTLLPLIHRRRSLLQQPQQREKSASFAYLDTLFELEIEGRNSTPTEAEIVTLVAEFISGGTDTTATAIEWAVARLIDQPEIQAKLHNEIVGVVGERKVDEEAVGRMPYLNAFTKELLRKHPPTYFLLDHAVMEATTLGGYDIPTDASVEFHLPSIAEDPKLWRDPKKFDPERFLSGGEEADMTGVKDVKMMPFGAGRRICPGLSMAMLHINLMVGRMVQEFEWRGVEDPAPRVEDYDEKFEFTVVMQPPLQAVIKSRK